MVTDLLGWLNVTPSQLQKAYGIGEARAASLMQQFQTARSAPYANWLAALGMPPGGNAGLGDWSTLADVTRSEWQAQPEVGPVRAQALTAFFSHPKVQRMAAQLRAIEVDGF